MDRKSINELFLSVYVLPLSVQETINRYRDLLLKIHNLVYDDLVYSNYKGWYQYSDLKVGLYFYLSGHSTVVSEKVLRELEEISPGISYVIKLMNKHLNDNGFRTYTTKNNRLALALATLYPVSDFIALSDVLRKNDVIREIFKSIKLSAIKTDEHIDKIKDALVKAYEVSIIREKEFDLNDILLTVGILTKIKNINNLKLADLNASINRELRTEHGVLQDNSLKSQYEAISVANTITNIAEQTFRETRMRVIDTYNVLETIQLRHFGFNQLI